MEWEISVGSLSTQGSFNLMRNFAVAHCSFVNKYFRFESLIQSSNNHRTIPGLPRYHVFSCLE